MGNVYLLVCSVMGRSQHGRMEEKINQNLCKVSIAITPMLVHTHFEIMTFWKSRAIGSICFDISFMAVSNRFFILKALRPVGTSFVGVGRETFGWLLVKVLSYFHCHTL